MPVVLVSLPSCHGDLIVTHFKPVDGGRLLQQHPGHIPPQIPQGHLRRGRRLQPGEPKKAGRERRDKMLVLPTVLTKDCRCV